MAPPFVLGGREEVWPGFEEWNVGPHADSGFHEGELEGRGRGLPDQGGFFGARLEVVGGLQGAAGCSYFGGSHESTWARGGRQERKGSQAIGRVGECGTRTVRWGVHELVFGLEARPGPPTWRSGSASSLAKRGNRGQDEAFTPRVLETVLLSAASGHLCPAWGVLPAPGSGWARRWLPGAVAPCATVHAQELALPCPGLCREKGGIEKRVLACGFLFLGGKRRSFCAPVCAHGA